MKTSNKWNFRPTVGKVLAGLVLATMIGSMDATPAFSKDHKKDKHDQGRSDHRGRGYDHDRYVYDKHGKRHYRQGYRGRVYAPPPVFYAPPPPPGISIFLPPLFIRP